MIASISSQVGTLTGSLRAVVFRSQAFADAPQIELSISGGLHDKCVQLVQKDEFTIGSELGHDLVLLDPLVQENHVRIAVCYSLLGVLGAVTASGASTKVESIDLQQGETSRHIRLPIDLDLGGGVTVTVRKSRQKRKKRTRIGAAIHRLSISILLIAIAAASFFAWDSTQSGLLVLKQNIASQENDSTAGRSTVDTQTLQEKLAEVGLDRAVTVVETPDGLIQVSGRLEASQKWAWNSFALWYDSVSANNQIVTDFKNADELPTMPPISMVRLMEPKKIFLSTGGSMLVNDVFSGEWRVSEINADQVVITRGDSQQILKFEGSSN